jgi:Mg-chelatase subunit ChlD
MQRDAIERLDLKQLLLEPELLETIEPDIHLVTMLVELNRLLPDETRATARLVIAKVLADLEGRLTDRTRTAVDGALARANRTRRLRRPGDVDWLRTVHANLANYQPEYRTVIPERIVGYGRRRQSLAKDVIVAVDQSGSMADSVVYASLFGSVLAQLPALRTRLVVFDTAVTDLTPVLHDPVDVLFGVQLGGGTDIAQAVGFCRQLVSRPADTVLVLISDLFEGGNPDLLRARVLDLTRSGVHVLSLLALSDEGAPVHDRAMAADLAAAGATVMACTPDRFPEVLAAALAR